MPSFQTEIGGRVLSIETGKFAGQANGAVTVSYGETVVLVTACMGRNPRPDVDFLPLTVDYEERLYAAGKIPGSFFRREGRPGEEAILAARLTDRPLRPLFPKGLRHDVQIVVTVLSADQENEPEILSIIGASAALGISDIPFDGPVGATRVGYIDGEFILNPTFSQLTESALDLVVAGTKEAVVMIEAGAREVPEEIILEAVKFGQEANQEVIHLQEDFIQTCGKLKRQIQVEELPPELEAKVEEWLQNKFPQGVLQDGLNREEAWEAVREELLEEFGSDFSEQQLASVFESCLRKEVRKNILEKGRRPSGRGLADIRPISCEVGTLPRTHGSGLFTRGKTQVLTITTLGSPREEQIIDSISREEYKRFMHHYNFPPFSTGETRRMSGPGRREIGHGALAERALLPVIPDESEFPYTIRLVSEVLSSNGSTSMASVCGGSLSLMDAGVPIKAPVAGIAMGLVTGEDGRYAILSDIEGVEDHFGDMDFKVAGTEKGVTAIQMDLKMRGIGFDIIKDALKQAREGRLFILSRMKETISESRPQLSKYAPKITKITIDPDKIRQVIGPGGRTIRAITEETKTTIEIDNDGTILIGSTDEEATRRAIQIIEDLTQEVEVGGLYTGRVTRITDFGAFVEIFPGKEGLVHISELADYHVSRVEDVVKPGDEIMVAVIGIDPLGRIKLSRKAVFEKLSQIPRARVGTSREGVERHGPRSRRPRGNPPGPRGRGK
ncbi:MAG: polyribonucleotide nucleotidyltransferase [Chloroflexi bacterium]|nr:MAG: polyribonucleotide nucleotidyltransferase [Chloroflexota bacterium]